MSDAPPLIPDFTLLRAIGRGAYGEVWLARSVTGVYRAVKIVRRDSFSEDRPFDREFAGIQRFESVSTGQESQVALLHVGRNDAAGFFYYVMELADDAATGEEIFPEKYVPKTLKELRTRQKRLPASECLDIGLALTRALAHLHGSGLVHRDIKPSNVIFVHGIPKLADVGLVSTIDTAHSFVGTEGFVPPEGPGTAAADIFGLGKVLYEISTGCDRTDFPDLPEDLDAVPDRRALLELNEVVLKACDSDPQRRYATAAAMRDDLLLLQAGRSVRRLHRMERQLRFIAEYVVGATIVAVLAVAGYLWASAQTRRATENFERAERAEAAALERMHQANLNWARANRLTGRPGQRFDSLSEVAKISAHTNRLDLRNEAIACLTLPDLRPLRHWAKSPRWDTCQFSDDCRLYVTNNDAGAVFVHDTMTGEQRHSLPAPEHGITNLVFSPDGNRVATLDRTGQIRIWTFGQETPVTRNIGPKGRLFSFTADSQAVFLNAGIDGVQFINATSGAIEGALHGLPSAGSVSLNPDGRHFLMATGSNVVVHRRDDGKPVRTIPLPEGVSRIQWHPDRQQFAVAHGKQISLWDSVTGRQRSVFIGHDTIIVGLAFDSTGNWMASASWDRTTRLWDTGTGREVLKLDTSGNHLRLSPDGRLLCFQSWDYARVHVYEVADTRLAQRFVLPRSYVTFQTLFSPDGHWFASVDGEGIFFFRPPDAAPAAVIPLPGTARVAFQSNGPALLTGSSRGIRRWPMRPGDDGGEFLIGPREAVAATYGTPIAGFVVSDDGRRIVAGVPQGPFVSFDPNGNETPISPQPAVRPGYLLCLNPDGTLCASGRESRPNRLQLWNPVTGNLITNLDHTTPATFAAFSRDNRWIAIATHEGITLRSVPDWEPRHHIARPSAVQDRYPVEFSPDSRVLAAVISDREVGLFDVQTAAPLATLPVDRMLTSLAFSPAGDALAVTSERGRVQLWNLRQLRAHLSALNLDWPGPSYPVPAPPASWSRLRIVL